jgi:hypothetical protein
VLVRQAVVDDPANLRLAMTRAVRSRRSWWLRARLAVPDEERRVADAELVSQREGVQIRALVGSP